MNRRTLFTSALGLCGVALFALGGCHAEQQSTVAWQPNGMPHHSHPTQDWWHYQFVYHPRAQVYFEPYSHMYYWFEEDEWQQGHRLPSTITLDTSLARTVVMKTPIPHAQHETVVVAHGPARGQAPASPWPDYFPDERFTVDPSMVAQQPTD